MLEVSITPIKKYKNKMRLLPRFGYVCKISPNLEAIIKNYNKYFTHFNFNRLYQKIPKMTFKV